MQAIEIPRKQNQIPTYETLKQSGVSGTHRPWSSQSYRGADTDSQTLRAGLCRS